MRLSGREGLIAALLQIALAICIAHASPSAAADTIGSVKSALGRVAVLRDGQSIPASPGFKLNAGDTLETGPDGRVGAILRDDSLVSLGQSSQVAVERFVFAPAEGRYGLTTRILRGTMAYISGLIGRLAPDSVLVVTPVATIGIRGTKFAVRVTE